MTAPGHCPDCGEDRLLEVDPVTAGWYCQVCGHGPPRLRLVPVPVSPVSPVSPAPDGLQALLAAVVQRHMPGQWQIVAAAPLVQWPRSLQKELRGTLGALTDTLVIVLERTPS